jgi:hypothetical protein
MPVSQKQLIANRNNAKKSTGPRTKSGKLAASRNAITHGLHARDNIITSPHLKESQTEFAALTLSLIEELNPDGALQTQLVHRIANCLWRARRAVRAETAHLNRQLSTDSLQLRCANSSASDSDTSTDTATELQNLAAERSIPRGDFMLTLIRYEMRLDLQLNRAYKLLQNLQARQQTKILQESYSTPQISQNEPISTPNSHWPGAPASSSYRSGSQRPASHRPGSHCEERSDVAISPTGQPTSHYTPNPENPIPQSGVSFPGFV